MLAQLFSDDYLSVHPISYSHGAGLDASVSEAQRAYSADEEEAIRARLQSLGYIE